MAKMLFTWCKLAVELEVFLGESGSRTVASLPSRGICRDRWEMMKVCNRHLCGPEGRENTHTHPLQLVKAFSTNCPLEYTFYWGRLLHRLGVNKCLQESCPGFSLSCTHMQEPLVDGEKVIQLNIQHITFSAKVALCHGHCCFTQLMLSSPYHAYIFCQCEGLYYLFHLLFIIFMSSSLCG